MRERERANERARYSEWVQMLVEAHSTTAGTITSSLFVFREAIAISD
jgi:hypothetical protein